LIVWLVLPLLLVLLDDDPPSLPSIVPEPPVHAKTKTAQRRA